MFTASGARYVRLVLGTAILFLAGRFLSDLTGPAGSGVSALWPGSGLVLGLLLTQARTRADGMAIVAGAGGGALLWAALHHGTPGAAALSLLASLAASVLAFLLLRRRARAGAMFMRGSDAMALIAACAGSSLVSASIGMWAEALGGSILGAWARWYAAMLLGLLVVTPVVVVLAQHGDRRQQRRLAVSGLGEIILVLGLVATIAELVFFGGRLPLLFTVVPVVLLATFRLRALGAVGAVAIVATISVFATARGDGPIALAAVATSGDRMLLLQLFLVCCFLSALPVAAILAERDARAADARALAERFRTVVETIGEVIFQIGGDGRWDYLNPAWCELSGLSVEESLGAPWIEHVDPADRADLAARVDQVLAGERASLRGVARLETPLGTRWTEIFVQGLRDGDGLPAGAIGTLRDIDDRKRLEEHVNGARRQAEQRAREATHLASTDELTGLANRRAFMRQLEREIAGAAEFGWPLSVALFDLDHFKRVNDRHGHAVGDQVLRVFARTLTAHLPGGDLVGRLGGEEFGILMPGASAEDAAVVAERLREAVECPLGAEFGQLPGVTVSIGVAEREGQRVAAALLAAADTALYAAKDAGRNRIRIAA